MQISSVGEHMCKAFNPLLLLAVENQPFKSQYQNTNNYAFLLSYMHYNGIEPDDKLINTIFTEIHLEGPCL